MIDRKTQADIELMFDPKEVNKKIVKWIESQPNLVSAINYGMQLYEVWSTMEHPFAPKTERIRKLTQQEGFDPRAILVQIILHVLINAKEKDLLINLVMPLVGKIKFSDRFDSIQTVFELVGLFSKTGFYQCFKMSQRGSLMVKANVALPQDLYEEALNKQYMPPVMSKPTKITHNKCSAYVTLKYSVFNGASINRHDEYICPDVLNIMNNNRFKLDHTFMDVMTDEPDLEIKEKNGRFLSATEKADIVRMKIVNFEKFKAQTNFMNHFVTDLGNDFSFNHRIDKRGRIYAEGFIFNPQGSSYRKGQIDFQKSVDIDIPQEYRL